MRILPGHCRALGATPDGIGVNFALWARLASKVELLLFADAADIHPEIIALDPKTNRSGYYWHLYLEGVGDGQLYGYRIDGPWRPTAGAHFDPDKVLLDPYGRQVVLGIGYDRQASARPGSNLATCAKSMVIDLRRYDWEDDRPPRHPLSRSILYELHVGGFTRHDSSGLPPPLHGTYRGLIEKIPYLQQLGITAVQLLPVFQFDPQDALPGQQNYWGYNPMSFFAPHDGYASQAEPCQAVNEFRDMVKALHRADIEVILDVVYNHSAEGDDGGPTFCFRGIDNEAYYLLDPLSHNTHFSGRGNTLNCSHPVTQRLILDSLRYWREQMHVDGFRLDLASILAWDEQGQLHSCPATLRAIDTDPVLADCKLIADTWDASGLHQIDALATGRWREWNSAFRDDVRRFIRGDPRSNREFAKRMMGSPDLYHFQPGGTEKCVNFITCHDGFTLWDLVSYNQKHNQANGEQNRDGQTENFSWNHGQEGDTDNPTIEALRLRQCKNLMSAVLLAFGTPMLLMGDEVLRSQQGNNNAYCQDNPLSWMPWEWGAAAIEMQRFVQELIHYRRLLFKGSHRRALPQSLHELLQGSDIEWHGVEVHTPDWSSGAHALAFSARAKDTPLACYLLFNAYWEPLLFNLPRPPDKLEGGWQRVLDTGLATPEDIVPLGEPLPRASDHYRAAARSVCLFICTNWQAQ